MKKIIFSVILSLPIYAQSQDNIIQHTVSKGETLYQISRNYNVSIQSIYQLNPTINPDIISPNQILLIPKTNTFAPQNSQDSNYIIHVVEPGETKFGLHRKYGASIAELESLNPHISQMLQVGHQVRIKASNTTQHTFTNSSHTHQVVAGETLYGISRKYNIQVNDLAQANRIQLSDVLRIGQQLTIPNSANTVTQSAGQSVNGNYHIVQAGETKFGLSKQYNTTVAKLEELNPQIVAVLRTGEKILIPSGAESKPVAIATEKPIQEVQKAVIEQPKVEEPKVEPIVVVEKVEPTPQPESKPEINYINYTVQAKETLYSLSKKANMSQEDFLELNPELKEGVKADMVIKMPDFVQQPVVQIIQPTLSDLEHTLVKNQTKNIAFVLPFSSEEFEKYKLNSSSSQPEMDFYSGALLAIDSLRNLGVKINTTLFNSNSEVTKLNQHLQSNKTDIIIGNYPTKTLSKAKNIPFVYASDKYAKEAFGNYIKPISSKTEKQRGLLDYLKTKNGNVIVVSDIEKTSDKELISSIIPEAKFGLLTDKANPNTANLKSLLSKTQVNYIFLNTTNNGLFINTTNFLLSEFSDYKIQLAVGQEIPNDISLIRLRILKTLYASNKDVQSNKLAYFNKIYSQTFKKPSNEMAIRGFDTTYDILVRLAQEQNFEQVLTSYTTQHIKHVFEYKKDNNGNYYNNNNNTIIYYYDTDSDAKIAK